MGVPELTISPFYSDFLSFLTSASLALALTPIPLFSHMCSKRLQPAIALER